MADPPKSKGKKIGGLKTWQWGAIGVGGFLLFVVIERRRASSATTASNALTGGTLIPASGTTTSTTTALPTSLASWIQDALSSAPTSSTYSQGQALNDINAWLTGSGAGCVSQTGYNWLAGLIGTLGVPPGYQIPPSLTVCASSTSSGGGGTTTTPPPTTTTSNGPPGAPPNLLQALEHIGGGASIVGTLLGSPQWDQTLGEWIYATNQGAIYALTPQGTPGTFFGSYLGLPANLRQGSRNFVGFVINPDGTYTLQGSDGTTYTFNPSTPQAA